MFAQCAAPPRVRVRARRRRLLGASSSGVKRLGFSTGRAERHQTWEVRHQTWEVVGGTPGRQKHGDKLVRPTLFVLSHWPIPDISSIDHHVIAHRVIVITGVPSPPSLCRRRQFSPSCGNGHCEGKCEMCGAREIHLQLRRCTNIQRRSCGTCNTLRGTRHTEVELPDVDHKPCHQIGVLFLDGRGANGRSKWSALRRQVRLSTQYRKSLLVAVVCDVHTSASRRGTRPCDMGGRMLGRELLGTQQTCGHRPSCCGLALAVRHFRQTFGSSRVGTTVVMSAHWLESMDTPQNCHSLFTRLRYTTTKESAKTRHYHWELAPLSARGGARSGLARGFLEPEFEIALRSPSPTSLQCVSRCACWTSRSRWRARAWRGLVDSWTALAFASCEFGVTQLPDCKTVSWLVWNRGPLGWRSVEESDWKSTLTCRFRSTSTIKWNLRFDRVLVTGRAPAYRPRPSADASRRWVWSTCVAWRRSSNLLSRCIVQSATIECLRRVSFVGAQWRRIKQLSERMLCCAVLPCLVGLTSPVWALVSYTLVLVVTVTTSRPRIISSRGNVWSASGGLEVFSLPDSWQLRQQHENNFHRERFIANRTARGFHYCRNRMCFKRVPIFFVLYRQWFGFWLLVRWWLLVSVTFVSLTIILCRRRRHGMNWTHFRTFSNTLPWRHHDTRCSALTFFALSNQRVVFEPTWRQTGRSCENT